MAGFGGINASLAINLGKTLGWCIIQAVWAKKKTLKNVMVYILGFTDIYNGLAILLRRTLKMAYMPGFFSIIRKLLLE